MKARAATDSLHLRFSPTGSTVVISVLINDSTSVAQLRGAR